MNNTKHLDDLAAIRSIMERSTKFLSLSALAAIMAGVYALVGAFIAYRIIYKAPDVLYPDLAGGRLVTPATAPLWAVALGVLVSAIGTGLWLSFRKAKRAGQPLWSRSALRLVINFSFPMAVGGFVVIAFYLRGYYSLLAASTLIFYGLALINAGNFTFSDVRKLGILEVLTGLAALVFPGKGLQFWAFGFGFLHLVYGFLMYRKYER
ncbi:MAG TPA: hypothetical protein PKE06_13810 [Flavilitoribacter sp.]|nr:hypothetical protein [Flavilitoribacter sp.]HMQ86467.1 hypothetical protein [Flavilitoribacter sp.]